MDYGRLGINRPFSLRVMYSVNSASAGKISKVIAHQSRKGFEFSLVREEEERFGIPDRESSITAFLA